MSWPTLHYARQRPESYFAHHLLSLDRNFLASFDTVSTPQPAEMGVCRDPAVVEIMHLRNIAWEAIGTATVDGTKHACYWHAWTTHCQLYKSVIGRQPLDQDTMDRLLTFAVAVREGKYGLGNQVKVQSVERALWHIAKKLILDRHPNPRRPSPA
jgi:hypothetical protein